MKYWLCVGIVCVVLSLPFVGHADRLIMDESKDYMKARVARDGVPFLDSVHAALKSKSKAAKNKYVRARLFQLSQRLEDEYATETMTWNIEKRSWKSGEKVFLTRSGDLYASRSEVSSSRSGSSSRGSSSLISVRNSTPGSQASTTKQDQPKTKSSETTRSSIQELDSRQTIVPSIVLPPSKEVYTLSSARIDITALQDAWIDWVNDVRKSRNTKTLKLEPVLHKTAADRSVSMMKKGVADHKRTPHSAYYAYGELVERFKKRGVVFENVSRATFTENVGYATVRCTQADCTDAALVGLRAIFDYFRSEEGQAYDAHRRSMIHPLFEIVGLGIAVDEEDSILYVTIHYGTSLKNSVLLAKR